MGAASTKKLVLVVIDALKPSMLRRNSVEVTIRASALSWATSCW